MKANPLAIAALLLALLGGLVWYTRVNPPEDADAAPKIVDLEEDAITEVTIARGADEPFALVRADGEDDAWAFGGSLGIAADSSSAGLLVSSLASLNAERVVSENVAEWGPYELDDPSLSVAFEHDSGSGRLLFGRDTPTGSGVFARLEGDPRLFTVYSYNKTSLDKSVFDLRDKRLLLLDEDSVSSLTVEAGHGKLGFERKDGKWAIVEPLPLRADDFTAGDLARVVRTAEMTDVLAEGPSDEHSFALPLATIRIDDEAGSHELVVAGGDGAHYARSSDQPGIFAVSDTLAEGFDKGLDEFRNKKLFDFGFVDPARVSIATGDETAVLARVDGAWQLESEAGREVASERVQTLLDRLRNLAATDFPSDSASAKSGYGLDSPAITATVEPPGDDGLPETVVISRADWASVYAAREGEPTTYKVEQSAALDIQRAVAELLATEDEGKPTEDSAGE